MNQKRTRNKSCCVTEMTKEELHILKHLVEKWGQTLEHVQSLQKKFDSKLPEGYWKGYFQGESDCANELNDWLKTFDIDESKKLFDELIQEAAEEIEEQNITANITGYQAPLGTNPSGASRKNDAKDPYRGHRSKRDKPREDADNKIRNAGSENVSAYVKKHPLDSIRSKP